MTYKDVITIVVFAVTIGGMSLRYSSKMALMEDQVKRNTQELKDHDLGVITYKLESIEEKLDKVLEKL